VQVSKDGINPTQWCRHEARMATGRTTRQRQVSQYQACRRTRWWPISPNRLRTKPWRRFADGVNLASRTRSTRRCCEHSIRERGQQPMIRFAALRRRRSAWWQQSHSVSSTHMRPPHRTSTRAAVWVQYLAAPILCRLRYALLRPPLARTRSIFQDCRVRAAVHERWFTGDDDFVLQKRFSFDLGCPRAPATPAQHDATEVNRSPARPFPVAKWRALLDGNVGTRRWSRATDMCRWATTPRPPPN